MAWIEDAFAALSGWLRARLGSGIAADALVDGVVAGVGGVVVFLPQILILFTFLAILEDSGYLTRAAFLVDRPLRSVGLSGRSFIPLLSSFACAVPGIMATRSIEDRRERLLAIFVAPLMTCSARLPVYTLLIGALVPDRTVFGFLGLQGVLLLGLYLLGVVLAAVAALVVNRALRKTAGSVPVILELAPYRWPKPVGVLVRLGQRAFQFLRRAGTVILAVSVILWALLHFPVVEARTAESEAEHASRQVADSIAGRLGHAIEPLIAPLGYDWRIGVGLIGSFAAREVFVSTMGVVYAAEGEGEAALADALPRQRRDGSGEPVYTLATVLSLLVFYAVALQCVSTIAVVYRETGSWRITALQVAALTGLAWLLSLLTYQIGVASGLG